METKIITPQTPRPGGFTDRRKEQEKPEPKPEPKKEKKEKEGGE